MDEYYDEFYIHNYFYESALTCALDLENKVRLLKIRVDVIENKTMDFD